MGCAGSKTAVDQQETVAATSGSVADLVGLHAVAPSPSSSGGGGGGGSATSSSHNKPHYGSAAQKLLPSQASQASGFSPLFGSKHAMLTYEWAVQEQVKAVAAHLNARDIPTWLDIDGGMHTDIYDSMARGVGNAAVVVPFLTEKYEKSKNCALELKFCVQTGVPVVSVMMQGGGWVAGGWLGLLTAGILWTPMHDPSTLEENVDGLVRQIQLALAPTLANNADVAGHATDIQDPRHEQPPDFSAQELRDELNRLKSDQEQLVPHVSRATKGQAAVIPPVVPDLPAGVLVTDGMQELLQQLMETRSPRIGFFGM